MDTPLARIIDAAANRAREALRVVEDFARFVWDDAALTRICKEMRHELAASLQTFSPETLAAARETLHDVGVEISHPRERRREDPLAVASVNLKRFQESLRSLEEYAKVVSAEVAERLERLRYQSYTLERAVRMTDAGRRRLVDARLYLLLDGRESAAVAAALAAELFDAGVDVIQLRDKRLGDRDLLDRGRALAEVARQCGKRFIVNDRPDLARLCRANGVHLGQEDLSVKDARTILGPDALIGVSTHTMEQVRQAVLDGANYLGVGPTFPSQTKEFGEFPGVAFVAQAAAETSLPLFALGGITLENLPEVLAAGATRVAVSAAILSAPDPPTAAAQFKAALV